MRLPPARPAAAHSPHPRARSHSSHALTCSHAFAAPPRPHQTRAYLTERDGFLVDNPKVGPTLRESYWRPGNSEPFLGLVEKVSSLARLLPPVSCRPPPFLSHLVPPLLCTLGVHARCAVSVAQLTGKPLSGDAWVAMLEQDVDELLAEERAAYDAAVKAKSETCAGGDKPVELDMRIKIVDGDMVIADTEAEGGDFLATCAKFASFVQERFPRKKARAA